MVEEKVKPKIIIVMIQINSNAHSRRSLGRDRVWSTPYPFANPRFLSVCRPGFCKSDYEAQSTLRQITPLSIGSTVEFPMVLRTNYGCEIRKKRVQLPNKTRTKIICCAVEDL